MSNSLNILGQCFPLLTRVPVRPDALYQVAFFVKLNPRGQLRVVIKDTETFQTLPHTQLKCVEANGTLAVSTVFRTTLQTRLLSVCAYTRSELSHSPVELRWLASTAEARVSEALRGLVRREGTVVASMAMLAERAASAVEAVLSLHPFVDHVHVFVPSRSALPLELARLDRVSFAFADETDELGDAGKFFWAEADASMYDYHFTIDDDLLYAPDYVQRMLDWLHRYGDDVLVGVHCVMLKQPLSRYYSPETKYTHHFHFELRAALSTHIIGTGTLAYALRRFTVPAGTCRHRNMADVWLAGLAQRRAIPRICVPREADWVVLSKAAAGKPTIFTPATEDGDMRAFMSSSALVQDYVVKKMWPVATVAAQGFLKFVYVLFCMNDVEAAQESIAAFNSTTFGTNVSWTVVLVHMTASKELTAHLIRRVMMPRVEVHVLAAPIIDPSSTCATFNKIAQLLGKLRYDMAFFAAESVRFRTRGWELEYWQGAQQHGVQFLSMVPQRSACGSSRAGLCDASVEAVRSSAFFAVVPALLEATGFCDTRLPGPQQFSNLVQRWGRRQPKLGGLIIDIQRGDDVLDLRLGLRRTTLVDLSGPPLDDSAPLHVSAADIGLPAMNLYSSHQPLMWGLFERSFVLSATAATWREIEMALSARDLVPSRFPLEDASVVAETVAQRERDAAALAKLGAPEIPANKTAPLAPVTTEHDFLVGAHSEAARRQYWRAQPGQSGGLAQQQLQVLATWIALLHKAMKRRLAAVLVLEDTVQLHVDFSAIMTRVRAALPADWVLVYLGGELADGGAWAEAARDVDVLVRGRGSTLGSYAVLVREGVYAELLHHLTRADMPVDVGALNAVCRAHAAHCYTTTPSLFAPPRLPAQWDPAKYHRPAGE